MVAGKRRVGVPDQRPVEAKPPPTLPAENGAAIRPRVLRW